MKINKIAPFEGELVWLGEMRQGRTQRGKDWQSIDFVIKYSDGQYDHQLCINAFGSEKVALLMATPIGSRLRVEWVPESHEYNDKWYTKASATEIKVVDQQEQEEPAKEEPQQATALPPSAPAYTPKQPAPEAPDSDLPFSQSPGVRG